MHLYSSEDGVSSPDPPVHLMVLSPADPNSYLFIPKGKSLVLPHPLKSFGVQLVAPTAQETPVLSSPGRS